MVQCGEKRHPAALRVADQRDRLSERCQPTGNRPHGRRNVDGANTGFSMSRQIGGVDLEGVATERLELGSGQREAVKRANNDVRFRRPGRRVRLED